MWRKSCKTWGRADNPKIWREKRGKLSTNLEKKCQSHRSRESRLSNLKTRHNRRSNPNSPSQLKNFRCNSSSRIHSIKIMIQWMANFRTIWNSLSTKKPCNLLNRMSPNNLNSIGKHCSKWSSIQRMTHYGRHPATHPLSLMMRILSTDTYVCNLTITNYYLISNGWQDYGRRQSLVPLFLWLSKAKLKRDELEAMLIEATS